MTRSVAVRAWLLPGMARAAVIFGLCCAAGVAAAAGTDVVKLADGTVVRGQIIRRQEDGGLLMAVRRSWLEKTEPALARDVAAGEQQRTREALGQLAGRIEAMLAEPAGRFDEGLLAFLRREQARVSGLLEAAERPQPQFLWLPLAAGEVRDVEVADPAWRWLVQWGWHEDLPDVETLSQPRLRKALEDRSMDLTQQPPNLADRLPPLPQDDDQWRARMALVDDAYGSPVTFQGTGDIVLRADGEVTIEALLPVITKMLSGGDLGGLGGLLDALGGRGRQGSAEDAWLASARRQAASEGRFRATRVQTLPEQGVVDVESAFEVRLADGSWATLWRDRERVDATRAREGLEERIAADPRVGKALDAVKAFGVIDEEALVTAIRYGAATMEAKEASDRRFAAFRSDHTLRLDGPPLVW